MFKHVRGELDNGIIKTVPLFLCVFTMFTIGFLEFFFNKGYALSIMIQVLITLIIFFVFQFVFA